MLGSTGLGTQTLGWDEVAMERALRIAGETGVFIAVSALYLWPGLPRTIATSLAILACVGVCMQIAFRLHDTDVARNDTISSRD